MLGQMIRLCAAFTSRARNAWYRLLGVEVQGYGCWRRISIPRLWRDITIERDVGLDDGVVLLCSGKHHRRKILIRSGTYINRYTMLDAHERIEIGRDCMIGPHCFITDGDHGTKMGLPINKQPMRTAPVVIEDDVWLGAGVIVLKGVRIGRGAVVGAGSVVTRDVESFSIAIGTPARIVGRREGELIPA
jgi:acetyltransferase-like isoleucine patch superfamily enzyme